MTARVRPAQTDAANADPEQKRVRANGIELTYFEWGQSFRGHAPTLLFAHATGFHARCWDTVIRLLGGFHVIAVDQRGHGRSEKSGIVHWNVFGEDLAAFARALGLRDAVGVGHSMGGHAMVDAAAKSPESFRRLVLIDPVILAPEAYAAGARRIATASGETHASVRRKRRFDSPETMIERFRDRAPYSIFRPEALRDYCAHGLAPAEDGDGFLLACPPEIEASIYMTSLTNSSIHESVRALEIPVLLLRARLPSGGPLLIDFSSSPTWPRLLDQLRLGREIHFAEHSHFLPMEIPEQVAALILTEAQAAEG